MDVLPEFTRDRPTSVQEALTTRQAAPTARWIAGGTDLIPNMRRGLVTTDRLIDVTGIEHFRKIEVTEGGTTIGAAVTLSRLIDDADIRRLYPMLVTAAGQVAAAGHRETATIGGNLCLDTRCYYYNQSEAWRRSNQYCLKHCGDVCHTAPKGLRCYAIFSGDLAPALLALGTEVAVASPAGRRRMALADLYRNDGIDFLTLAADELITAIHLPAPPPGRHSGYRKLRLRGAFNFPLGGVAVVLATDGDRLSHLTVALTGTNAMPVIVPGTEAMLGRPLDEDVLKRLGRSVTKRISIMPNTLADTNYRRITIGRMTRSLVQSLYDRSVSA